MRGVWLLGLLLAGCPYRPERIERTGTCTPDTPELGVAGEYSVERFVLPTDYIAILGDSSGPLAFRIPVGVQSIAVTWEVADTVNTRISYVQLDDDVLLDGQDMYDEEGNGWDTPPLFHLPENGATVVLPLSPDVQLRPGACLIVEGSSRGSDLEEGTLTIQTRRDEHVVPTLDLNIYRVGDTVLADEHLSVALDHASTLWSNAGAAVIGEVREFTVEGPTIPSEDEVVDLYTLLTEGPDQALNILLVQDLLDNDGTLGFAGGIPGAIGISGAPFGAVVVSVDTHLFADGTMDSQYLGETIAHEAGHQIGLAHTTEASGSVFELLTDTPECPLSADVDGDETLTAEECAEFDGANFMFWSGASFPQDEVSEQQADIIQSSVIVTEGAL